MRILEVRKFFIRRRHWEQCRNLVFTMYDKRRSLAPLEFYLCPRRVCSHSPPCRVSDLRRRLFFPRTSCAYSASVCYCEWVEDSEFLLCLERVVLVLVYPMRYIVRCKRVLLWTWRSKRQNLFYIHKIWKVHWILRKIEYAPLVSWVIGVACIQIHA